MPVSISLTDDVFRKVLPLKVASVLRDVLWSGLITLSRLQDHMFSVYSFIDVILTF